MKIVDKIMDALSLYDEEEILDEDLETKEKPRTEEKKERASLFKKKSVSSDQAVVNEPASERKPVLSFSKASAAKNAQSRPEKMGSKTLSLPVANKLVSVVVLEPVDFNDSQKIADYLRSNQPVVVNFANTDNVVAKRMTDFISGTVYAIGGSMKKLGRNILVCAPKNVDIDAGVEQSYSERGNNPWEK